MIDFIQHAPAHFASIAFANENWLWASLLFGVGAAVFLIMGYRGSPLRGGWRVVAIGLKAIGMTLLALSLMEPVWVTEFPKKGANDLVILADNSKGLSVIHPEDGKPLGEEMTLALRGKEAGAEPAWLAELSESFRLQNYLFDHRLKRTTDFSELDLNGNSSALFTSLRNLKTRYARRPLAATILFTDGNATDSAAVDEVLQELAAEREKEKAPAPIFPVVVGKEPSGGFDLGIQSLLSSQSAFEDAPLTITVEASARGELPNGAVVYVKNEKDEEVLTEPVGFPLETGYRVETARLRVPAVPPGVSYYRIGIRSPGGEEKEVQELTLENNERLVSVDRGRGPYRILYVSGRPNWEYKFLRRSISQDSEIDLVGLIRIAKQEPKFEWRGKIGESSNPLFRGFDSDIPEETQRYDQPVLVRLNTSSAEELRDGFPKTEEELFSSYRAIIIDDLEAKFFTQEQLNLIDQFSTRRGGSVIMLGGQESFKEGGWNNTPVARMLPVYLDQEGRDGPALEAVFNLSREGWLEPWMRLRPNQSDEETRLAYMPGFFAINRLHSIKPGASILATVTDSQKRLYPALVTQRYGEGKTAALAVGDMWRWGMKDAELQEDLARTWRQLLRWAVVEVPDRVQLTTSTVTEGNLPVTAIEVQVRDLKFNPQDDASVKFTVIDSSGEEISLRGEPSLEKAGVFTASHYADEPGGYRLKATARDGEGKIIGEEETGWVSNPAAEEFSQIGPQRDVLRRIAEATGGEVLEMAGLGDLPRKLGELSVPVLEVQQRPLWHTPWFFLVAIACFLGEWGLRRWKGIL